MPPAVSSSEGSQDDSKGHHLRELTPGIGEK